MSGGGGNSTTTTGLPEWARPYVEESLESAVDMYKVGAYENVAGLTPEQIASLESKKTLGSRGGVYDRIAEDSYGATQAYRDASSGTGLFGANALGQQTDAMKDSIGTAVRVGGEMAAAELANRRNAAITGAGGVLGAGSQLQGQFGAGADLLGSVGSAVQQQNQNEGDAAYQGIQRLFGLYGSPALGSTSTSTGGGK